MGWLFLIAVIVSTLIIGAAIHRMDRRSGVCLTKTQRKNLELMADEMRRHKAGGEQ